MIIEEKSHPHSSFTYEKRIRERMKIKIYSWWK